MAFFTFTTVSGSAATNNLVYSVSAAVAGAVTVSLSSAGTLVYTNAQGNSTDSGYTLANLAPAGLPGAVTGADDITVSLSLFQTPTFTTKLNQNGGADNVTIDATGATAAQIDAFIANPSVAAAGSLTNASLDIGQFGSLTSYLDAAGAIAIDATGATAAQIDNLFAGSNEDLIKAGAISNADVTATQFAALTTAVASEGKFAAGGASIDGEEDVTLTPALITDVANNQAAVATVSNVALNQATLESSSFGTFAAKVAGWGVTAVNAASFTTGDWQLLMAYRTIIDPGSVSNVDTLISVSDFLNAQGKLARGAVLANNLSLATATSAQVDGVVAAATKLASGAVTNATISAAQFTGLTSKLADGAATVNASGATDVQETAILNYLAKFAPAGLTNLTLTPAQYSSLSAGGVTDLETAAQSLTITAGADAFVLNAADFGTATSTLVVNGSEGGDVITGSLLGKTTVQGAKGKDVITGGNLADLLQGGNAADTINGGAGNDTLVGGNSLVANVLTGGGDNDTFVTNGGVNTIEDLGNGSDIVQNSATVSSTVATTAKLYHSGATVAGTFTASAASTNAGALTVTAAAFTDTTGGTATATVNLAMLQGAVGATVIGGVNNDTLSGSANTDSISGGAGADVISGLAGHNTLVGGAGIDTFNVAGTAVDTITDFGTGTDVLTVAATGTANVDVVADWTAAGVTTKNFGTAILTLQNAVDVVLTAADAATAGTKGFNIVSAGVSIGSSMTGSGLADTITGSGFVDTIIGGIGADVMTGGSGNDIFGFNGLTNTGLASNAVVTTSTATLDKMFVAAGDTINLTNAVDTAASYDSLSTLQTSGVISNTVAAATVQRVQGYYDASANTFTVGSADANAVMLSWDDAAAGTAAAESVILVGVTNVTSIADGVITV